MVGALSTVLVSGATNAVGRALAELLVGVDAVLAIARRPRPRWWATGQYQQSDLLQATLPPLVSTWLHAGPLGLATSAIDRMVGLQTLIAVSSVSVVTRAQSLDPIERAAAAEIERAERALVELCAARSVRLVLLRSTLIWGYGLDLSLTPLVQRARRYRVLPWPSQVRGLRQPIHAADLAAAMWALAHGSAPVSNRLVACGSESLRFDLMLERSVATVGASLWRMTLPTRWPGAAGRRFGAFVARGRVDQHYNAAELIAATGITPRGFEPVAADFGY